MTIEDTAPVDDTAPEFSEQAIAQEFADRHFDELRYVAQWSKWFIWDGACWREDRKRRVYTRANKLCREIARSANKPSVAKTIASAKTRAAVVALAGEDTRLVAGVDQWDTDPWLLNTPDGVVDLRTGVMREHRAEDLITRITAVSPSKDACPLWHTFLDRVTGGDKALQQYLQRVCGYALTGLTREHALFFLWGTGAN